MPGQPREGQSGPGSASAVVLREARAPWTSCVRRRGGRPARSAGQPSPRTAAHSFGSGRGPQAKDTEPESCRKFVIYEYCDIDRVCHIDTVHGGAAL